MKNKIRYVEVFTTLNIDRAVTWARFRHEQIPFHKHETYEIDSIHLADRLNKVLKATCTISGCTIAPWGIVSIVYTPKPTGKVVEAREVEQHEIRRESIRKAYEKAGIVSNTNPTDALILYNKAKAAEINWYEEYVDLLEEDESIMPESFYLDVVPLIESRASAAARGKRNCDLPASYYVCPVCGRQNDFTLWVSAHWDIRAEHNCFCGAKNYIKQGVLVD